MKKKLLIILAIPMLSFAQVGINTNSPDTTLDIRATNHNGAVTATDGVLVPRVNNLTANGTQNGQLVYLIANYSTFIKGFYYWDGTKWTAVVSQDPKVTFKTAAASFPSSPKSGDETYVTLGGASTEPIIESHIFDGTNWVKNDVGVNDQANSKYIDIGNVRIQWGTITGTTIGQPTTVTFPQPFADTSYSFTGTTDVQSNDFPRTIVLRSKTSTHAVVKLYNPSNNGGTAAGFDWQAIGIKP